MGLKKSKFCGCKFMSSEIIREFTTNDKELLSCSDKIPIFSLKGNIYIAKIVDVYDGDSCKAVIRYKGDLVKFPVRMFGYDTPEMKPLKSNPKRNEIISKAKLSKAALEKKVLGKIVEIHCKDFDKYGRILGIIYSNPSEKETNLSVNDWMVKQGFGYKYFGGTKK
jgi:endonuclease YncB( thermonuclease family)